MQIHARLSMLLLFSTILIVWVLALSSADLIRRRAIGPQPIEAAFAEVRIGMREEELVALMAPYHELDTEHLQWRYWIEGRTVVFVTVWPKNFRPIRPPNQALDGPDVVWEKEMHKEALNQR
jgi:hypothetical protein